MKRMRRAQVATVEASGGAEHRGDMSGDMSGDSASSEVL